MELKDRYFQIKIAGQTIVCRFIGPLWNQIKLIQESRKIGTVAEFIKLELYDEFSIHPADEGKLLREIEERAPYPNPHRSKKQVPEKKISTVIVTALKERLIKT